MSGKEDQCLFSGRECDQTVLGTEKGVCGGGSRVIPSCGRGDGH